MKDEGIFGGVSGLTYDGADDRASGYGKGGKGFHEPGQKPAPGVYSQPQADSQKEYYGSGKGDTGSAVSGKAASDQNF